MPLTPDIVELIDSHRKRGQSYDEVVAKLELRGVPAEETEPVLQEYRKLALPDGRRREEVNLGDPDEEETAL